jgi:hypothetical protein
MFDRYPTPDYAPRAGAKSSAGFGDPKSQRRNSAHRIHGAFFMPAMRQWWLCVGDLRVCRFYLCDRFANLRTAASITVWRQLGTAPDHKGASPMTASIRLSNLITRSLSSRAAAHRAMAKAALFADSSTRTRLKRYNHHIDKAQQLEARALETAKCSVGVVS